MNYAERDALLIAERQFDAYDLQHKYSPQGHGEHCIFPIADWQDEVSSFSTLLGYWVWVEQQIADCQPPSM